jgi:hypothetical protein
VRRPMGWLEDWKALAGGGMVRPASVVPADFSLGVVMAIVRTSEVQTPWMWLR